MNDLDYKDFNALPETNLICTLRNALISKGTMTCDSFIVLGE